jgi:hypothetical protein
VFLERSRIRLVVFLLSGNPREITTQQALPLTS